MPVAKHILSINAAVMNCVTRCSESQTPYVCLADFLEKLEAMGWSSADTGAVRTAVLPMIGQLMAHPPSGTHDTTLTASWSPSSAPIS